jgi:hypothetical protein
MDPKSLVVALFEFLANVFGLHFRSAPQANENAITFGMDQIRAGLKKCVGIAEFIAERTATTVDNLAVAILGHILDDDQLWGLVEQLVDLKPTGYEASRAGVDYERCFILQQQLIDGIRARMDNGTPQAIDPLTIITMINAIIDLIAKIRRNRNPQPQPAPAPTPAPAPAPQI